MSVQMQEVVQETGPGFGWSSAWPSCLNHPDRHSAGVALHEGVAVWECPRGGGVRVPVGELPAGR